MKTDLKNTSAFLVGLGLTSPAVVIDRGRVQENIRTMSARAATAKAHFRPHFKTHQSGAIGQWFRQEGVTSITVSSLSMAEYFVEFGWLDITLAFLLNPLEMPRMGELARYLQGRGGRLGLTIDSAAGARILIEAALPVDAWIKIDAGYGRTGVPWDNGQKLSSIRQTLDDRISLAGLLTHSGHSYQARNQDNLQTIWDTTLKRMRSARESLGGLENLVISLGDTPCCCTVETLAGADEVRPGNFVFFDLMQLEIGSCRENQLAAAVACPVVGLYPDRGRVVVHGGAVQLAKEQLAGNDGQPVFGKLGTLDLLAEGTASLGRVLHQAPVVTLSQEHGTIAVAPDRFEDFFGDLKIGDLVLIWPVHSCLACHLFDQYHTLDGEVLPRR